MERPTTSTAGSSGRSRPTTSALNPQVVEKKLKQGDELVLVTKTGKSDVHFKTV